MQLGEVSGLREQLSEQARTSERELAKKEAEKEIILDDHEALSDQYQDLNMNFQSQAVKLTEAEVSPSLPAWCALFHVSARHYTSIGNCSPNHYP